MQNHKLTQAQVVYIYLRFRPFSEGRNGQCTGVCTNNQVATGSPLVHKSYPRGSSRQIRQLECQNALLSFEKHFCFTHIKESTHNFCGHKSSGRYHAYRGQVPSGHYHTYRGQGSSGYNHTYRGRGSSGHNHTFDIPRSRVQRSMSGTITSAADAVKGPAVNATRPA